MTIGAFLDRRFIPIIILFLMIPWSLCAQNHSPSLIIPDDSVRIGDVVQIPVIVNDADSVCAFQFSLILPDGIIPVPESRNNQPVTRGEILTDHIFNYNYESGVLHVVCLSIANSIFSADSGVVCNIVLQPLNETEITDVVIGVTDIELSSPSINGKVLNDISFKLHIQESCIIPDDSKLFTFNISPFRFNESFESEISITSSVNIKSISFSLTVPEQLGNLDLVRISSQLANTNISTDIVRIDSCHYDVLITASNDSVFLSGYTEIVGIKVDYDVGILVPGTYVLLIDDILVTAIDGTIYELAPFEYRFDFQATNIEPLLPAVYENISGYFLDGRRAGSSAQGVMIQQINGKIYKIIRR